MSRESYQTRTASLSMLPEPTEAAARDRTTASDSAHEKWAQAHGRRSGRGVQDCLPWNLTGVDESLKEATWSVALVWIQRVPSVIGYGISING